MFTNKGDISKEVTEKAKGNIRILRSSEFVTLMSKYIELMEKSWRIEDPTERLAFMDKIPALKKFGTVFKTSSEPLVSLEEINSLL